MTEGGGVDKVPSFNDMSRSDLHYVTKLVCIS